MSGIHLKMSQTALIVILYLCTEAFTAGTATSVLTTLKTVDSGPATSVTKASTDTTTTSSSTTTPAANPTTNKSEEDKKIINSIPTFDFSFTTKEEPKPKVVNTCSSTDMCMTGLCIKGTCKTKKCSTEVYCVCDPGFTGQFCDKNITQIELKNGKTNGNGKYESSSPNSSTNKEVVNDKLATTPTRNESVNASTSKESVTAEPATTTANKDSSTTTTTNKDSSTAKSKATSNTNSTITKTSNIKEVVKSKSTDKSSKTDPGKATPTPKVLANGDIDQNLINSKTDAIDKGNSENNKNINVNGKKGNNIATIEQIKHIKGKNVNVKSKTVNGSGLRSIDKNKRNGNAEIKTKSRKDIDEPKQIKIKSIKSDSSKMKKIKQPEKGNNMNKKALDTTKMNKNSIKDTDQAHNSKTFTKMPSDGSYVKGPEVHVVSDHSVVDLGALQKEIKTGKQTLVNEQADVVTISATSVKKTRLGVAPEMLTAVARDSLKSNIKTTSKNVAKHSKQAESSGMKKETKLKGTNGNKIAKRKTERKPSSLSQQKEKEKSQFKVVSATKIAKSNPVFIVEESGSVSVPNNTVIDVNPLFTNSEIKITIETSNVGKFLNDGNVAQETKVNDVSTLPTDQRQEISKGKVKQVLNKSKNGNSKKSQGRQENTETVTGNVDILPGSVLSALQKKSSLETPHKKKVGASQSSETRKSTKSEILSPIMQLMNIFRSNKFVENVSAVKIEIITKQNSTDAKKPGVSKAAEEASATTSESTSKTMTA